MEHPHSITVRQAEELRKQGEVSQLTKKAVEDVLKRQEKEKKPEKAQQTEPGSFAEYFPEGSKAAYRKKVIRALLEKWKKGEIQI